MELITNIFRKSLKIFKNHTIFNLTNISILIKFEFLHINLKK